MIDDDALGELGHVDPLQKRVEVRLSGENDLQLERLAVVTPDRKGISRSSERWNATCHVAQAPHGLESGVQSSTAVGIGQKQSGHSRKDSQGQQCLSAVFDAGSGSQALLECLPEKYRPFIPHGCKHRPSTGRAFATHMGRY